ncbi:hypothetical protein CWI42_070400 [Ordospora colligata]|uniref:J domain-containing protein n=1 Tax=Ordospora colligata OC4 TaxID=1354746 RepID=A0A0B2UK96_9MICR|nr:uncharacterized protein M896_070400 [Ordospora colligata OC4]KHN69472.1 hypothetical protein M896_070400 [Ordospora colligata OC4]TBU15216.1 hypothetical protein CWI41_070400 [Ordospora colligata]TBU15287.1 hypothetical protein CWI40_070400 [Ordospora colligata]TBU18469.1 hypothetical protein CWI42_070400 [Ordospora colligata]
MKYILFLIASIMATLSQENLGSVIISIRKLHEKTPYSTFYEVLGVSEASDIGTIKKQYQRIMRNKALFPEINKREDAIAIVTEAYNILKNKKDTYDMVLSNSYMYLGNKKNFNNNFYLLLLSGMASSITIIAAVFAFKRLMSMQAPKKHKNSNSKNSTLKKESLTNVHAPSSSKSSIKSKI